MKNNAVYKTARDIRLGKNAEFDAWLFSMLIDNNISYQMNPQLLASPEQIRFMVAMDADQVYLPCGDAFFRAIENCDRKTLQKHYNRAWRIIVRLIRSAKLGKEERKRRLLFCKYRFRQSIATGTLIPSRLVKRMVSLAFYNETLEDLWAKQRFESYERQMEILQSKAVVQLLQEVDRNELYGDMPSIHNRLNFLDLARRFYLSMSSRAWLQSLPSVVDIKKRFASAVDKSSPLELYFSIESEKKTILFLVDADGGFVFDLYLLTAMVRQGHRIIVAVKENFHFFSPTMADVQMYNQKVGPGMDSLSKYAYTVTDSALSKNALIDLLREHKMLIISDGTQERMNLTRVSVTFSRAWKEADLVIAKGWRNAGVFLKSEHDFTRDILCYWLDEFGEYHMEVKPRPSHVHKFSESDLAVYADKIISEMRAAHEQGKTVMFYSCIIGSIPGQTPTAIKVVTAFVENMRKCQDSLYIINPAEHFVEGMDGDDLMYMWERVQRSGYIDVWRFQSVEDIEESFRLLGRKVPSVWAGKDATYSTGCTKEMRIAVDVQKKNREMQLIGPDLRMFFRRSEYGVGKYFDATIA